MTLPNERYRAVENAREFLRDLVDPKKTPRVPKEVRKNAYWVLRHFPSDFDMLMVAEKSPKIFNSSKK